MLFQFFVRTFREIMSDEKASSKELSLAMKGYGLLAAVSCLTFIFITLLEHFYNYQHQIKS